MTRIATQTAWNVRSPGQVGVYRSRYMRCPSTIRPVNLKHVTDNEMTKYRVTISTTTPITNRANHVNTLISHLPFRFEARGRRRVAPSRKTSLSNRRLDDDLLNGLSLVSNMCQIQMNRTGSVHLNESTAPTGP